VTVGVIDSGWDRSIDDPRVRTGVGFVGAGDELAVCRSADDQDRIGHGTAAADIVLQVAPGATVVPLRVFGRELETSPAVIIAALDWAVAHGIGAVNLSLGTARADAVAPLYRA
jgi:hypothetical protein